MEDTKEGMSDESEEERKSKKRVPFKAKAVINPVITPIGDAVAGIHGRVFVGARIQSTVRDT